VRSSASKNILKVRSKDRIDVIIVLPRVATLILNAVNSVFPFPLACLQVEEFSIEVTLHY